MAWTAPQRGTLAVCRVARSGCRACAGHVGGDPGRSAVILTLPLTCGQILDDADSIEAFHAALPLAEREGLLWRMANQSLLSDLILELHAAGYHDMSLNASVRAVSVRFALDLGLRAMRVAALIGVFVPAPSADDPSVEDGMEIVSLVVHLDVRLPRGQPVAAGAPAAEPAAAGAAEADGMAEAAAPAEAEAEAEVETAAEGAAGSAGGASGRAASAGLLRYVVRAAQPQPHRSRQRLLGAAQMLAVRYEHEEYEMLPACLRWLAKVRAGTVARDEGSGRDEMAVDAMAAEGEG